MEIKKTVFISKLPKRIQQQLPYSIRTYKDEYVIEDLPSQIQFIIQDYLKSDNVIKYTSVYDITPQISEYGDFGTLNSVNNTILEYIKNYFLTLPNDYPFEPLFGSRLKYYLNTKDTQLRKTLISSEADIIVETISAEFDSDVKIISINVDNINKIDRVEYLIHINLTINDQEASIRFGTVE